MTLHRNARTCPRSRKLLVDRVVLDGWSISDAAAAAGVSQRTACKWLRRFREEGEAGLADRSSAPRRMPTRTAPERVEAILALRELRFTAARSPKRWGWRTRRSRRCSSARQGRLPRPDGDRAREPLRARPARRAGPRRRQEARPDRRRRASHHRRAPQGRRRRRAARAGSSCTSASMTARAWPTPKCSTTNAPTPSARSSSAPSHGSPATASASSGVMTDNGNGYRSHAHAAVCRRLGLRHLLHRALPAAHQRQSRALHPTLTERWAYGGVYLTNPQRRAALPGFLDHYNYRRPHRALDRQPPIQRLAERNNLTGTYT